MKISLVLFSLLRARNNHYNKGPVIFDNIKIIMIQGGLLCMTPLQWILLRWVINIVLFLFTRFSEKWSRCNFVYWTTMIFLFLLFFRLKYFPSFFLTNFESMLSLYLLSHCFEAVKEFHKFHVSISINRTTLHLLFVGHQVRKNTCQCISTIKFQLHSSLIIPKKYQFVITLSTSQHKDRSPFRN